MNNKKPEKQKSNKLTPAKVLAYIVILISSYFFIYDAVYWFFGDDSPNPPLGAVILAYYFAVPAAILFLAITGTALVRRKPQDHWFLGVFAAYVLIIAVDWIAAVNSGV